jgi:aryl-alcohol dehydrogenase-like predicted oxidoreductase
MIERQPFGRTGHLSSRTIFGAAALGNVSPAEAERTLDLLREHGVNHIDTANSYGEAEARLGPWLARHRAEFFLATKTGARTRSGAREHLERSLDLLRTDQIDLWQLHNLVDEAEWEMALGPGGALEALIEARDAGLVRFLGVTGHGTQAPRFHRRSLERFDFDAVLLPYSYVMMQNPQYAADFEALAALCAERKVAVQTIKAMTRRPWGEGPHRHNTWYEPFEDQADIDLAVHWVLGQPQVFLNTAADIELLPRILEAAARFAGRPADEAMGARMRALEAAPLFV